MFFPCTNKEKVEIDYNPAQKHEETKFIISTKDSKNSNRSSINPSNGSTSDLGNESPPEPAYLSKPTIIMCNPNALYYQQMVTSPNAYWLNFFLKRDINVVCWNYRGYGESEKGSLECVTTYKSKLDAERVLAFLVNNIKVKGKIGTYGRSIGGIAACHISSKYP